MIIISPSKRQADFQPMSALDPLPNLEKTKALVEILSGYSVKQLSQMLKVSESIAQVAYDDYQTLLRMPKQRMAAIDLYQGDVFKRLEVSTLSTVEKDYLQNNLRIISPLYGLIAPNCGILPYRLEMVSKLDGIPSLQHYWSSMQVDLEQLAPRYIFNLASKEYASCLHAPKGTDWIDIVFQDKDAKGQFRIIAVKAKRMRGQLLRYMAKHHIQKPEQLYAFSEDDYKLDEVNSSPQRLLFRNR